MNRKLVTINDLPDVIIEYIFSLLSPYNELLNCKYVCKKWYFLTHSAIHKLKTDFKTSIKNLNIEWNKYTTNNWPNISGRYSHSSCLHSQYMFIFGGCTKGNTQFNDLWMFDLNKKVWSRPLMLGNYPPPKACASMVAYKNNLVLFGGWTHYSDYPLHRDCIFFNDLHKLDLLRNKWKIVKTSCMKCPPIARHSASVIKDKMIIYGGLYSQGGEFITFSVNTDIWIFDFITEQWSKKTIVSDETPSPRYDHSQIVLDDKHIVIFGGCGMPKILYNDIWLLVMKDDENWYWKKIEIEISDTIQSPILGFHPAVKVEDMIIFLSKNNKNLDIKNPNISINNKQFVRQLYRNKNNQINSPNRLQAQPSQTERKAQFLASISSPLSRNKKNINTMKLNEIKEDQLIENENVELVERRIKNLHSSSVIKLNTIKNEFRFKPQNPMSLHVLDISKILCENKVTWINQLRRYDGPDEIMLYTLVAATNELILFGGIEKIPVNPYSFNEKSVEVVSNSVYVISAKRVII